MEKLIHTKGESLSWPEIELCVQWKQIPHLCTDPACPGDINRRKLEAYDALECNNANKGETIQSMNKDILRMSQKLQIAEEMAKALRAIILAAFSSWSEDWTNARNKSEAALSAWDKAGKEE